MRCVRLVGLLLLLLPTREATADESAALVLLLKDRDRGVRYAAAMALGKAGLHLERVVPLLDDPVWCVRQAAENAFVLAGEERALDHLAPALRNGSAAARLGAAEALARLGRGATPLLRAALKDREPAVVVAALDGLLHRVRAVRQAVAVDLEPLLRAGNEQVQSAAQRLVDSLEPAEEPDKKRALAKIGDASELEEADTPAVIARWRSFRPDLESTDAAVRVASVRVLGRQGKPVLGACADPCSDVRAMAARFAGSPNVLVRLLADKNWRVRRNALRSLGRIRARADAVAPFLADPNLSLAWAAADALRRIGGPAALPVAHVLAGGNPAVLRLAPSIFGAAGKHGAPAVGALAHLLAHDDVNVRDVAAQCLARVGRSALDPTPALVAALEDPRLCVVANAARALARLGPTPPLVAALRSKRARVRAYAAFALGEALGARRGLAYLPYEPRLPVLDAGTPPDPLIKISGLAKLPRLARIRRARRGLWSRDPAVALACAAALDYDEMDARECERAVELLLPEGLRSGSPIDFEKLRSYLGSTELGAFLEYFCRARATAPTRKSVYGALHRLPRSDDIPMLGHFRRSEDSIRLGGFGELLQPYRYTARFPRDRSGLWDAIERFGDIPAPERWWLLELDAIPAARAALLVEVARRHADDEDARATHSWVGLKALGATRDAESKHYLRHVVAGGSEEQRVFALAALAQRGSLPALVRLVRKSATDAQVLGLLLESFPRLANRVLRERLADPKAARACAELVHETLYHGGYLHGLRVDADTFLGIEPSLQLAQLDDDALLTIALRVPGCGTRRVAQALLDGIAPRPPALWLEYDCPLQLDSAHTFLSAMARRRYMATLRGWGRHADPDVRAFAFRRLIRLGDLALQDAILAWLAKHPAELDGLAEADGPSKTIRYPGLLPLLIQRARTNDSESDWLDVLYYQGGPILLLELLTRAERSRLEELCAAGRGLEWTRDMLRRHPDLHWTDHGHVRSPWLLDELRRRLASRSVPMHSVFPVLVTWPDAQAQADYWSIMRAGRYRWVADIADDRASTLDGNLSTLTHWAFELESNCCRANPRPDGIFRHLTGDDQTSQCNSAGIGQPPTERVRRRFELYGIPWRFR